MPSPAGETLRDHQQAIFSVEFIPWRGTVVTGFVLTLWSVLAVFAGYEMVTAYLKGQSPWVFLVFLGPVGVFIGLAYLLRRMWRIRHIWITERALILSGRASKPEVIPREAIYSCEFRLENRMHPELLISYVDISQRRRRLRLSRFYYRNFDALRTRLASWDERIS